MIAVAFEGRKYTETKHLPLAEVAKLMRNEIKGVQLPDGVTVRVICADGSITFYVDGMGDARILKPAETDDPMERREYTDVAAALLEKLNAIRNAYQRDDSDVQVDHFDVRFYGRVEFVDDRRAGWNAQWAAEAAVKAEAAKARREAGAQAEFYATFTAGVGVQVFRAADDHRVGLIKVGRRWGNLKTSQVEYLLHSQLGYEVVHYQRASRDRKTRVHTEARYMLARTWTVPVERVA